MDIPNKPPNLLYCEPLKTLITYRIAFLNHQQTILRMGDFPKEASYGLSNSTPKDLFLQESQTVVIEGCTSVQ